MVRSVFDALARNGSGKAEDQLGGVVLLRLEQNQERAALNGILTH
jgi:hypothetical protein